MASTDIITHFQIWNQGGQDAERQQQKSVLAGLDTIEQTRKSRVVGMLAKAKPIYNGVVRWEEEKDYALVVTATLTASGPTLTVSGNLFGEAADGDALKQHCKIGTVVENTDGVQLRVTAISDYDTLAMTVAEHGNTAAGSLSDDSAARNYYIIGEVNSDYDTTYIPKAKARYWREVGVQISKESFEIPYMKQHTRMENANDFARQWTDIITNLSKKRDRSALRMVPTYASGAYKHGMTSETPAMCGLSGWSWFMYLEDNNSNLYVDMNSVPVDTDVLNALVYNAQIQGRADFGAGKWILAMHPVQHQFLSDEFLDARQFKMDDKSIGYEVTSFKSKIGKRFPLIADENMREDTIHLVNVKAFKRGVFGPNGGVSVKQLGETMANIIAKKISVYDYGLVARKPRQNIFSLVGLPTTYA